jgi:ClpP class serine protease
MEARIGRLAREPRRAAELAGESKNLLLRAETLPIASDDAPSKIESIVLGTLDEALGIATKRRDLLSAIEGRRKSKVLAVIHGRDWKMERKKLHTFVDMDTADEFLSALRSIDPEQPLDIILHTPGGALTPGYQIARALKAHRGKKIAYVPFHAFSMGTIIALVADEIVMGEHAVLGPIDPQIDGYPAADLLRLKAEKPLAEINDVVLLAAYDAEKLMAEARQEFCDLVHPNHVRDQVCALTDDLVSGQRTHGHPIGVETAKSLGINVSTDVPAEVFDYVELCRELDKEPALRHRGHP